MAGSGDGGREDGRGPRSGREPGTKAKGQGGASRAEGTLPELVTQGAATTVCVVTTVGQQPGTSETQKEGGRRSRSLQPSHTPSALGVFPAFSVPLAGDGRCNVSSPPPSSAAQWCHFPPPLPTLRRSAVLPLTSRSQRGHPPILPGRSKPPGSGLTARLCSPGQSQHNAPNQRPPRYHLRSAAACVPVGKKGTHRLRDARLLALSQGRRSPGTLGALVFPLPPQHGPSLSSPCLALLVPDQRGEAPAACPDPPGPQPHTGGRVHGGVSRPPITPTALQLAGF